VAVAELAVRVDPFGAFCFEVRVDQITLGGFSECGGLQREVEVQDYPEGGLNAYLHKLPVRVKQNPITLKRGIADRTLWDWHDELANGIVRRRNGAVVLRDPSGDGVVAEWRFERAYPVKWVGPTLNATQNQVAVEQVDLVYEGLTRAR
jgi:phage tail-like protein